MITVLILLIYLTLQESSSSRTPSPSLIVLTRPRSRHTSTLLCDVYPQLEEIIDTDDYLAPHIELINLYRDCGGKGDIKLKSYFNDDNDCNLRVFSLFKRVIIENNVENVNALIAAVAKSVLSYCLYEVLLEKKSMSEILESYEKIDPTANNNDIIDIDVAIGVPDDPYTSSKDLTAVLNKFSHVWRTLTPQAVLPVSKIKLFLNNLIDDDNNRVIVCHQLCKSLAVPLKNGEGNREPLPQNQSNRRPVSGIFKKYSLKKMPFISKTAMEPELSIFMSNLGNINRWADSSCVIDPYCGSCQLLIASALQGAKTNIGLDVFIDEEKINKNFEYMNLDPPSLHQALAESLIEDRSIHFSATAIITDPPYAMQEDIHSRDDEFSLVTRDSVINEQDGNFYTNKVIQNLLHIASSSCLRPSGRLVFWIPYRAKNQENLNAIEILPKLPTNLSFLFSMKQVLSPTFCRYLVVIEKNY